MMALAVSTNAVYAPLFPTKCRLMEGLISVDKIDLLLPPFYVAGFASNPLAFNSGVERRRLQISLLAWQTPISDGVYRQLTRANRHTPISTFAIPRDFLLG